MAAIDLGSNSFHMVVGRVLNGTLRTQDKLRERVRIAGGLTKRGGLTEEAQLRGLGCLERFSERLQNLPEDCVRAVGTNAFRSARNARAFLERAEEVLGHPIEIVSGQEEARLIYLGVAHDIAPEPSRRLVVDIGGGSTECILGEGFDLIRAESLETGCVSFSQRYFPDGKLCRDSFDQAMIAAQQELPDPEEWADESDWDTCIGTSGTAHAVRAILTENGWADDCITYEGLRKLRKALIGFGQAEEVDLAGLRSDRKAVLPGGLAILLAVFKTFEPGQMVTAPGGLREGLLYDLFGRFRHEDVRERTVRAFMTRYQVDGGKARRVEKLALELLAQAGNWKLDRPAFRLLLAWSARLHEVGLAISHSGFHKHGEFLVAHSDMPGFSNDEQSVVAALVRFHRQKIVATAFEDLPHIKPKQAIRLCILLRLSVLLNRSRSGRKLPPIEMQVEKSRIRLHAPEEWLESHPLTRADLKSEAAQLSTIDYELEVADRSAPEG